MTLDDISNAIIALIRVGAGFRFVYCMVRLESAEEEATQRSVQQYLRYRRSARSLFLYQGCISDP